MTELLAHSPLSLFIVHAVLIIAVTYTLINLIVDLVYLTLDPRIRYQ